MITIKTSKGDIQIDLDAEKTPSTVENFLNYVRRGFYDNTIFHRVIDGFMIQGGGMTADMNNKTTDKPIQNEAQTGLQNKLGTIAMARTMDPHSATSQFFINVADNDFLNFTSAQPQGYGYCAFGKVVDGMDVVEAIAKVKTAQRQGHGDVPLEDVVIHEIREDA